MGSMSVGAYDDLSLSCITYTYLIRYCLNINIGLLLLAIGE